MIPLWSILVLATIDFTLAAQFSAIVALFILPYLIFIGPVVGSIVGIAVGVVVPVLHSILGPALARVVGTALSLVPFIATWLLWVAFYEVIAEAAWAHALLLGAGLACFRLVGIHLQTLVDFRDRSDEHEPAPTGQRHVQRTSA